MLEESLTLFKNQIENMDQPYQPVTPLEEIAVALSGGGFRAASFSIGCLSYLERVIYQDKPLLKR
jgi:hypothetical protein